MPKPQTARSLLQVPSSPATYLPARIVTGAPTRPLRARLNPARVQELEDSRWWERSLAELVKSPPVAGLFG